MRENLIAVGSKNPVKIAAALEGFRAVWPDVEWEVEGFDVPSGISHQPFGAPNASAGATTRAWNALDLTHEAAWGVGMEGYIYGVAGHWLDAGFIAVVNRAQGVRPLVGYGETASMEVPPDWVDQILENDSELGDVLDAYFGGENLKQKEGHMGIFSNGILTRTSEYRSGVVAALARFIHPEPWDG